MKVSSELAQDRRAWSASVRDVVNSIGDAGSTRPGRMPTQLQISKVTRLVYLKDHRTTKLDERYIVD